MRSTLRSFVGLFLALYFGFSYATKADTQSGAFTSTKQYYQISIPTDVVLAFEMSTSSVQYNDKGYLELYDASGNLVHSVQGTQSFTALSKSVLAGSYVLAVRTLNKGNGDFTLSTGNV